jgi:hypothetical protein
MQWEAEQAGEWLSMDSNWQTFPAMILEFRRKNACYRNHSKHHNPSQNWRGLVDVYLRATSGFVPQERLVAQYRKSA